MQEILGAHLAASDVKLEIMSLDLTEIQGTSEEIISDKLRRAIKKVNAPVICEDTSLCFEAYKGLPGPYM